jgi:CRP-like cAMP-binding protein
MLDLLHRYLSDRLLLTQSEIDRVSASVQCRHLDKGATLLSFCESATFLAFVWRGCLRAYFADDDGSEHVLHFAPEGWCLTDTESFLTREPSSLAIDAIEASDVFLLERTALHELRRDIPSVSAFYNATVERALRLLQQRVTGSLRKTAEQRYRAFIELYPGLDARIPQYQIAGYIGVSPEFLSKLRARIVRDKSRTS